MPPFQSRVRLAGREFSLSWLRARAAAAASWFVRARAEEGHGWCLCQTQPLRLVIRHRSGTHHLAVWPGEGPLHHRRCRFHSTDEGVPVHGAAINRSATGRTTIRINMPLRTHTQTQNESVATVMTRRGGGQASTSLMGMLHHLWESAQLHTWQPETQRRWGECTENIRARISTTRINGQPLDEVLYVVPPYVPAMSAASNSSLKRWRTRIGRPGRRGLLLGEIKTVQPSRYGYQARLWHLRPTVYLRTQPWERARRSYRSALAKNAPEHVHRIVLCVVEITRAGYLQAVDIAVLLTTHAYVPADSGHEVRMAEALMRAGRSFVKPMRFDTTSHEVLPDFLLTDTDPPTCVEVHGMLDNPDYARRQHAKRAYYHANGIPLIEWDVRAALPTLRL